MFILKTDFGAKINTNLNRLIYKDIPRERLSYFGIALTALGLTIEFLDTISCDEMVMDINLLEESDSHNLYKIWLISTLPMQQAYQDLNQYFQSYDQEKTIFADILQPAKGLNNIFLGLTNLCLFPLVLALQIIEADEKDFSGAFLIESLRLNILCFGFSLALIIRGIQQILTTPLDWFIKIPFRTLLTLMSSTNSIENLSDVVKIVNQIQKTNKPRINAALGLKLEQLFSKKQKEGLTTNFSQKDLEIIYAGADRENWDCANQRYHLLSIFGRNPCLTESNQKHSNWLLDGKLNHQNHP